MSDFYYAPEEHEARFSFSEAPVHNIINSICLLNQDHVSRVSAWVDGLRTRLTVEEKAQAKLACRVELFLAYQKPATVEELINGLRTTDPKVLTSYLMNHMATKARIYGFTDIPTEDELASSEQTYLSLVKRFYEENSSEFEEDEEREEYRQMLSPGMGKEMADAVEHFWINYLKEEWPNVEPQIRESVSAFNSITVPEGSLEERLRYVTGRDNIPEMWLKSLSHAKEIVYVPSVHIGPYMILFDFDGETAFLVGRARVPEGAAVHSRSLDRSELLMRLEALSDSVRLSIIEQAAAGHVTTSSIMESLQLSQSSASRHLNQLAATGILVVDGSERTKKFSINNRRIDELFQSLRELSSSSTKREGE